MDTKIVDHKGLAEFLNVAPETIRKVWSSYPHFFVGEGRNLKSARFDVNDVLCYLKNRDYNRKKNEEEVEVVDQKVSDKEGSTVQGEVHMARRRTQSRGVQNSTKSTRMDGQGKEATRKKSNSIDRWDILEALQ